MIITALRTQETADIITKRPITYRHQGMTLLCSPCTYLGWSVGEAAWRNVRTVVRERTTTILGSRSSIRPAHLQLTKGVVYSMPDSDERLRRISQASAHYTHPQFTSPPPVLCSLIDGELGSGRSYGGETGRDAIARSLVAFFEEEARFIIGLDGRRLVSTSCLPHFSHVLPYVVGDIDVHTPLHAMTVSCQS